MYLTSLWNLLTSEKWVADCYFWFAMCRQSTSLTNFRHYVGQHSMSTKCVLRWPSACRHCFSAVWVLQQFQLWIIWKFNWREKPRVGWMQPARSMNWDGYQRPMRQRQLSVSFCRQATFLNVTKPWRLKKLLWQGPPSAKLCGRFRMIEKLEKLFVLRVDWFYSTCSLLINSSWLLPKNICFWNVFAINFI